MNNEANEPSSSSKARQQPDENKGQGKQPQNLALLITELAEQLNTIHHNRDGFARDNDEEIKKVTTSYGYISNNTVLKIDAMKTRNQNFSRTVNAQYSYIKSPDGPYNHEFRNVGVYKTATDPKNFPFRLFKVQHDNLNMDSHTFDINKTQPLSKKELDSMTTDDIKNLPILNGKTENDAKGELVVRPYELIKSGTNGAKRWRPHQTLLRISDYQSAVSPYLLGQNDEVQFTLANDLSGRPFAINITKVSMNNTGPRHKNYGLVVKPYTYKCSLSGTTVSTETSSQIVELDTFHAETVKETLEATQNTKHIHLIPSPEASFTERSMPLLKTRNYITAGDLRWLMQRDNVPGRWQDLGLDKIHKLFLGLFTDKLIEDMIKNGSLNSKKQAHWVIHHTQDMVTNITTKMVQNDYNNQHIHSEVLSTTLITKTNLQGRAGKINSQIDCLKISESWTNPDGYEVPLQIKNYDCHKILNGPKTKVTTVNIQLDIHRFTDEGDKLPTNIITINADELKGKSKEFVIMYTSQNEQVKKTLQDLSEGSDTKKKHIQITYPFGDDEKNSASNNKKKKTNRSLRYGKYRVANITILTNATNEVITRLCKAGVSSIGPRTTNGHKFCKVRSKHYLSFPSKLDELMRSGEFKMIEIVDRGVFRFYLHDEQTTQEVNKILELSNPSEFNSLCLTTPVTSPWVEIDREGKSILINHVYDEKIPEKDNVIYVSGIETIMEAEWIQNMIKKYTGTDIVVVEQNEETLTAGNVCVRFLQNIGRNNEMGTNYSIAISSENTEFLQSLKQSIGDIRKRSGAKYDSCNPQLNRLKHVLDVISVKSEQQESTLPSEPVPSSQSDAENDPADQDTDAWNQVESNSKKNRKRKKNGPPKTTTNKNHNSSNKYDALLGTDEDEDEDEKVEREMEDGDFNLDNDTIITAFMEKSVKAQAKLHSTYTEKKFKKLTSTTIKLVSGSSPDYNKKKKIPAWFMQKTPMGLGQILIRHFKHTETCKGGSIDTIHELLDNLNLMDSTKWQTLRLQSNAIQEQNAVHQSHNKEIEAKEKNSAVSVAGKRPMTTPLPRNKDTKKKQTTLETMMSPSNGKGKGGGGAEPMLQ
jgi:predicted small secreted protein